MGRQEETRAGGRERRRTYLEHLVGGGLNAGYHVRGGEGQLLHLGEVIGGVAVEDHSADLLERVVFVRPDLGQVEGVEGGGLGGGQGGGRGGREGGRGGWDDGGKWGDIGVIWTGSTWGHGEIYKTREEGGREGGTSAWA